MAKDVLLIVRSSPLRTPRAAEGLRQAVGLFIKDHRVTVALQDGGVLAAAPLHGQGRAAELQKHLETLIMLGYPVWAEEESLAAFGMEGSRLRDGIQAVSRARVDAAMTAAAAVVVW